MSKNLVLAVTPSIKLRRSQAKLYKFIVNKYQAGEPITLTEVIRQYSEYGNRNIRNGEPYSYVYNWKERHMYLLPLRGEDLRTCSVQWFIRNMGTFVVKGLLTAIPTINLSQLQIEE